VYSFISIPRNASATIHNGFKANPGVETVPIIRNHLPISKYEDPGFSFALIREPVRRLQSWYWFHVQKGVGDMRVYDVDIEEWAEQGFPVHNWGPQEIEGFGMKSPLYQWDYVNIDGGMAVDWLLEFESLNRGWEEICKLLGLINHGLTGTHSSIIRKTVSRDFEKLAEEMFPNDFMLHTMVKTGKETPGPLL